MKRSWIGLLLLIGLLAGSWAASNAMTELHEDSAEKLEQASHMALSGNWAGAAFLTAQVRHSWDKWEWFRAAQSDHNPTEEIDAMFAALEVYGNARERVAFSALCREMAKKIQAVGEAHSLKFSNLL